MLYRCPPGCRRCRPCAGRCSPRIPCRRAPSARCARPSARGRGCVPARARPSSGGSCRAACSLRRPGSGAVTNQPTRLEEIGIVGIVDLKKQIAITHFRKSTEPEPGPACPVLVIVEVDISAVYGEECVCQRSAQTVERVVVSVRPPLKPAGVTVTGCPAWL